MSEAVDARAAMPILVDASNVAWWAGAPPSLRLPAALLWHLRCAGADIQLVFDASARHHLAHEAQAYAALLALPGCTEVARGRRADGELLRQARKRGGLIVSRDRFRDHRRRYRKLIDDRQRVIDGMCVSGRIVIPALGIDVPLSPTAGDAVALLLTLASAGE